MVQDHASARVAAAIREGTGRGRTVDAMNLSTDAVRAPTDRQLVARFWRSASGYWRGPRAWWHLLLGGSLILIALAQLFVQYRLNYWNRDFFNALAERNAAGLWWQSLMFVPLVASSVALAIASVWGRMTTQRRWRAWLTSHLIEYWLANGRYRLLHFVASEPRNPEYRIAEDARISTDAPIDLALGLLTALLTAVTFIGVLWSVGDSLPLVLFGNPLVVPGYLVIAVIIYAATTNITMMTIGRRLTRLVEAKNQAEAELISAATRLRVNGESGEMVDEAEDHAGLQAALTQVLRRWRGLCWQLMRTTLVSHGNLLLAPVVAWILCAPKYLAGTMALGELVQAAAAFVLVQGAFNWFLDNYQRVADWNSSVHRVAALLLALDEAAEIVTGGDPLDHEGAAWTRARPAGGQTASMITAP